MRAAAGVAFAALIVAAHVALWRSSMPASTKAALTALNAAGWAVVILPAVAVTLWARAIRRKNRQG